MLGEIETKNLEAQPVLTIRKKTTMKGFSTEMGKLFGRVWGYIQEQGVKPAGMPFAIYYEYGPEIVDMACGIPVTETVDGAGDITFGELPSGRAVKVSHFGSYGSLGDAHEALDAWMKSNEQEASGPPWEVYVTDPGEETDSTKWRTDVFYPL